MSKEDKEQLEKYLRFESKNMKAGQLCDWWIEIREKWNKCKRNNWRTEYIETLFRIIDTIYKERVGGKLYN